MKINATLVVEHVGHCNVDDRYQDERKYPLITIFNLNTLNQSESSQYPNVNSGKGECYNENENDENVMRSGWNWIKSNRKNN